VRETRTRYVIPDYLDPRHRLAHSEEEKGMVETLFAGAEAVEPTSNGLRTFLAQQAADCDLIHFACHGEVEQQAVLSADLLMRGFQDGASIAQDRLTSDSVKRYARFAEEKPATMVFVNACKTGQSGTSIAGVSGFADAFLRPNSKRGAAAVVGALWSVDDKLALKFAESFYRAMRDDGMTLVEASKHARNAAKDQTDFSWLAYTFYGNPLAKFVAG
jgi:CHAT domain-containing protein